MNFRWWYLLLLIPIILILVWVLYRYYSSTSWKCITATSAPVRRNFWGDIQCMSTDGQSCNYQCPDLKAVYPDNPVNCGSDHKRLYGITGYDTEGHWCKIGDAVL